MSAALGSRKPAHRLVPPRTRSSAAEAVALLASIDVTLDPWQVDVLTAGMGRERSGRWVADDVLTVVARQNGKSVLLLARALWGALRGGERLILFSAHEFKTCREAFLVLKSWCDHPAMDEHGPKVSVSHGKEGVEFADGARILFIARSRTSGRGFSPDLIILDEAQELDDLAMAALKPALAAADSPQVWFAGSAPHETSVVLRRLLLRAREGTAARLVAHEWCAPDDADLDDVRRGARQTPPSAVG